MFMSSFITGMGLVCGGIVMLIIVVCVAAWLLDK
jgi:hypothetical protein